MKTIVTVETPATATDLTVLATVKDELAIDQSDNAKDRKLRGLIRTASGIVANWCNRRFPQEEATQTFWPDSSGGVAEFFSLERYPVSTIASVTVDDIAVAASEYRLDAEAGLLHRLDASGYPWCWSFCKSAVVVYTAGYQLLDGLPDGIERATVILIKEMFYASSRDPRIKAESAPGLQSYEYWVGQIGEAGELPPDVVALLSPHRRPMS